jgi:hypothetical protein
MISILSNKNEKKVLQKMVLMYIHKNMDENIKNNKSVDKIIEEIVKELLLDMDSKNIKKPLYIEIPISQLESQDSEEFDEFIKSKSTLRPASPIQMSGIITYYESSYIYKIVSFLYHQIINKIIEKINTQEFHQRYHAILNITLELFRVITSSLMIIFVPQKCGDHICTLNETIIFDNNIKGIGLTINFITLFSFFFMYLIEIWRENLLIKYLDVNPNIPNDSEYLESIMEILPNNKKQRILSGNKYYMYISYLTIIIYIINAVFSGIIINKAYLSNQTYATFITYVIFMINKLTNAYTVVNTDENVFYSSYLKTNVQFNDIDRNYKKVIEF